MIATILPGSTNFHAVGYNEHKVSKGVARLIEIQNFGSLGTFHKPTPSELVGYLQKYSSQNSRIRKPQFHVAISCKGHEMSEDELLDFAHQYLKEMGYGESGQPLLVYSHYDTENTHLHIITSRVAPNGRKIQHSHERRRSQEVIDRILGNDRKKKTEDDINLAKLYTFSSFAQFKAIMVSMGYEVYQKDENVFVKHGGKVQKEISFSGIRNYAIHLLLSMMSIFIDGFFGKRLYAISPATRLVTKLSTERYLVCSMWQTFLSSSLMVSMSALFLSSILSYRFISEFFMFFLIFVTRCMSSTKRASKRSWLM